MTPRPEENDDDDSGIHAAVGDEPDDVHSEDDDEDDEFPNTTSSGIIDQRSMAQLRRDNRTNGPPSVAPTELASAVGSVVGPARDAFLKSITFYRDQPPELQWGIELMTVQTGRKGGFFSGGNRNLKLVIDQVSGAIALSKLHEGDALKTINKRKVGPSLSPELAVAKMHQSLEQDGYLSLTVGNKEDGDDILVQATIIKPHPKATLEDMGMVVWMWGFLCIKEFKKESIFRHTVLKETDHIVSINDIVCDEVKPPQFAMLFKELPYEVTITVLRRKQRATGSWN